MWATCYCQKRNTIVFLVFSSRLQRCSRDWPTQLSQIYLQSSAAYLSVLLLYPQALSPITHPNLAFCCCHLPYFNNTTRTLLPLCTIWTLSGSRGNNYHPQQWWGCQLRKHFPSKSCCGFQYILQDLVKTLWWGASWYISSKPQQTKALKFPHSPTLITTSSTVLFHWGTVRTSVTCKVDRKRSSRFSHSSQIIVFLGLRFSDTLLTAQFLYNLQHQDLAQEWRLSRLKATRSSDGTAKP